MSNFLTTIEERWNRRRWAEEWRRWWYSSSRRAVWNHWREAGALPSNQTSTHQETYKITFCNVATHWLALRVPYLYHNAIAMCWCPHGIYIIYKIHTCLHPVTRWGGGPESTMLVSCHGAERSGHKTSAVEALASHPLTHLVCDAHDICHRMTQTAPQVLTAYNSHALNLRLQNEICKIARPARRNTM